MKKTISFVVVLSIVLSLFVLPVNADMYGTYDDSFVVTYGGKTLPLKEYTPSDGAIYFSKDGKACTYHPSGSSCSNCKKFSDSQTTASQCLGFAFYVQKSLFGCYYWNYNKSNIDKFDVIKSFDDNSSDKENSVKNLFLNVRLGSHIRTKAGHSMIFAKSNDTHVWTYEANVDHQCRIRFKKRTWLEMYEYIHAKGLNYISSPKTELFTFKNDITNDNSSSTVKTEGEKDDNKKTCWWHISYNSSGYCKKCGTEYDMDVKNMSSTTYQAVKNDVPVRNRPYSPEKITKWLSKGTKVTVVASGKNSAGNLWYKLNDGSWIYSKNLEKAKAESSTLKINVTQYPTTIDQGKSFGLRGDITSNYSVTSVKGYIKNSSGSTVMTTSDSPNSKSNDIRSMNVNQNMSFGKLSSGTYTLEIVAKDSYGASQSWSKSFTVKAKNIESNDNKTSNSVKSYSKKSDGEKYLSKNFQVKEFACKDGSDYILIDDELVVILQNIRDHFGKSVTITSAYRNETYNKKIGGAGNSNHVKGMAADISVSGVSPEEVAKYAETIGVRGIGKYNSKSDGYFVHVDTRENKYYWIGQATKTVSTHGGVYNSKPYNSVIPNKEVVPEASTLKINVTQYPTTIDQGKSFGLRGNITSNYSVTSVKGCIKNSSGSTVMTTSDSPNAKSNDIRSMNVNQNMSFGKLSAGTYTLEIVAKDSYGKSQSWSKSFTVKGEETKPVNPSCKHSYNDSGYCKNCKKEYPISLSSMNATYEAVKNDVPVRNRPYAPDKIIKHLSKGTKVTVVASGKNSQGNLWYKLNDGTWIYSGNLTKSSGGTSVKYAITNPNQTLKNGSKGSAVKELQTALNKIMGAGLSVDGIFGNGTKKAVTNFQSKYGLSVDGIAGPKTLNKINEVLK